MLLNYSKYKLMCFISNNHNFFFPVLRFIGTASGLRGRFSCASWKKRDLFAHRFFAEEEVVDDKEEVFPRGHNHPAALLQQLQLLTSQHMLSHASSIPTQLSGWSSSSSRRWIDGARLRPPQLLLLLLSTRKQQPGCPSGAYPTIQEEEGPGLTLHTREGFIPIFGGFQELMISRFHVILE